MSLIVYNKVALPYNYTTRFDQRSEYDESGTDRCYTVIDLTTTCIVTSSYLSVLAPDLVAQDLDATDIMRVVRSRLLTARRDFSVMFNGTELIPNAKVARTVENSVRGSVDCANGPIPQSCDIMEMTTGTYLLSFHIIAKYWENYVYDDEHDYTYYPNRNGNDVLYNRWEETLEYDANCFCTRTRSGKLKIRSDNQRGIIADEAMDRMCVLGVPKGFLRKSSKYTVSPDGLAIAYTIVDEEQFKMPPSPAYQAAGHYLESSTNNDAVRRGEVRVMLRGNKEVPQEKLVTAAYAVAADKLYYNGAPLAAGGGPTPGFVSKEKKAILEYAAIKIDMYKNEVECNIRVRFPASKKRKMGIAAMRENLVFTPISDDSEKAQVPPDYPLRGTAQRILQAAAYYDPSLVSTVLDPVNGNFNVGKEVGTAGKYPEA